ncbi:MAG TPA: NAD(P)-dependent oxidoreductase [Stellaceae bacterium]|nr:NAD(P)-dependent oxidoreductase [Stellaceae bacterium]
MTIVVTGIQSFIGAALARVCQARGKAIVGIDARADTSGAWHQADIRSLDIADLVPEEADAIIHLAALSRDSDCRDQAQACFDANVMGTLNLIAAAKARRVRHFVFASSEWVYDSFAPGIERTEDTPIDAARLESEYALSKYVSENNLRQQVVHGFCPVSVLRFGIVYGPRKTNWSAVEALLNAVARQNEVTIGARATARRFIHVTDVVEGVVAALDRPAAYEVYNVQGPALVSLGDVIGHAAEILGRHPRIVETAPGTPSIRAVSSRKATQQLGWSACIGIRDGMADVARYLGLAGLAA